MRLEKTILSFGTSTTLSQEREGRREREEKGLKEVLKDVLPQIDLQKKGGEDLPSDCRRGRIRRKHGYRKFRKTVTTSRKVESRLCWEKMFWPLAAPRVPKMSLSLFQTGDRGLKRTVLRDYPGPLEKAISLTKMRLKNKIWGEKAQTRSRRGESRTNLL